MKTPSDEELMLAVGKGDFSAFEQIVLRHQKSAWYAAYRFLGDRTIAEDVAQEALLKILDAAERYRPTAKFRTYLYGVVTRLCLDHARKKQPAYVDDLSAGGGKTVSTRTEPRGTLRPKRWFGAISPRRFSPRARSSPKSVRKSVSEPGFRARSNVCARTSAIP